MDADTIWTSFFCVFPHVIRLLEKVIGPIRKGAEVLEKSVYPFGNFVRYQSHKFILQRPFSSKTILFDGDQLLCLITLS